jgi:hypothetical protein
MCALAVALPVQAESPQNLTDGVYGRFDGDLDFSLAAGVGVTRGGSSGAFMGRVLYLDTAGIYVAYTDAFGDLSPVPPRSLALGVGLRPLFIPRWGYNLDRGPVILDLTIDATTFDFGVLWPADEKGHFTELPGVELALGTEVPLAGEAAGPWIGVRGALRWRGSELSGESSADPPPVRPAIFFTFAWHVLANAHLVDAGDRLLR